MDSFRAGKHWVSFCRKKVTSLSKKVLKNLGLYVKEQLLHSSTQYSLPVFSVIQDLVDFRLNLRNPFIDKKAKDKGPILPFFFCNKGIEQVNLNQVIVSFKPTVPPSFKAQKPMVVYKRSLTIANKIFNYKQTVDSIKCNELVNE